MNPKEQDKLKGEQLKADLQWLLNQPQGRRLLRHWLLGLGGLHRTTFSTNALVMAMAEGKRSMALDIEGELTNAFPEGYALVLSEHFKEMTNV